MPNVHRGSFDMRGHSVRAIQRDRIGERLGITCARVERVPFFQIRYSEERIIHYHIGTYPFETSCTCLRIYNKNASLDYLPSDIIVDTGLFARYNAIAKLELMECVPTSDPVNPKPDILSTVCLICVNKPSLFIWYNKFPICTTFTFVFSDVPLYLRILSIIFAHITMGISSYLNVVESRITSSFYFSETRMSP